MAKRETKATKSAGKAQTGKGKAQTGKADPKAAQASALFMRTVSGMEKTWTNERKKQSATGSGDTEVPEGRYHVVYSDGSVGVGKDGVPWCRLGVTILSDEDDLNGVRLTKFCRLKNNKLKDGQEDRSLEYLARTLHGFGLDAEGFKLSELPAILAELKSEKPHAEISVKHNEKNGNVYQEFYVNRPLDENGDPIEEDEEDR